MNQLPQKQENQVLVIGDDAKSVALAIYNRNADAITLRRKMVNFPEVAQALNQTEKFVFVASTKTPIAQIDQQTLISKTKQMFKFIAMDVGFKIPDGEDWTYTRTRLYDLLRKYYSQLTLAEVKLAFELSVTGELDDFLPKNSSGQADKNHYQQFNAAYFTKILNAYKDKQAGVFTKAIKALPAPSTDKTPEELAKYHNATIDRCKYIFLKYKYFGKYDLAGLEHMFVYDWLFKVGLADDAKGTTEDRERAYKLYLKRIDSGMGNKWDAVQVRREGSESSKIDFTVFEISRDKEIKNAFLRMVEEGIYVNDYLEYK